MQHPNDISLANSGEVERASESHVAERASDSHVTERASDSHVTEHASDSHVTERASDSHVTEHASDSHVTDRTTEVRPAARHSHGQPIGIEAHNVDQNQNPGTDSSAYDVVIVGAGASGLFLAHALLRKGLTVLVLEQLDAPARSSRSIGIHPPSMVLFAELGLADALRSRAVTITQGRAYVGTRFSGRILLSSKLDNRDTSPTNDTRHNPLSSKLDNQDTSPTRST
jgi:hypothetical protein